MIERPCPTTSLETLQQLRAWCGHALGQQLVEAEQAALREVLSDVFGYHLVVVDPSYQPDSLESSRILHRVQQSCTGTGLVERPGLLGCAEALPLQSDSIDAFVLPHVLERALDAHQVLREIDRCLVAEGHLIALGFNPYGWWGLSRLTLGWRGKVPWALRFVSVPRLKDWLSLLGFDTLRVRYLFPHPPWAYRRWQSKDKLVRRLHRDHWPWLAAAYLLVARKRVATLTPIKPRWRPRRAVLAGGVAGTSQSRVREND
ncbi:MAG: methyltransferase domain-containing protein [Gammaproteobacteria bacterium]|jgi:SAM-dependent methyltransferase